MQPIVTPFTQCNKVGAEVRAASLPRLDVMDVKPEAAGCLLWLPAVLTPTIIPVKNAVAD